MDPNELEKEFKGTFFSLRYPGDWEELVVEDIPTFFDPEAGGVLQVVAATYPTEEVDLKEELIRILFRQGIEGAPDGAIEYVNEDGIPSLSYEYIHDNRFWLVHFMVVRDRLLLMQFNSDETPRMDEALMISSIIRSVKYI